MKKSKLKKKIKALKAKLREAIMTINSFSGGSYFAIASDNIPAGSFVSYTGHAVGPFRQQP